MPPPASVTEITEIGFAYVLRCRSKTKTLLKADTVTVTDLQCPPCK